MNTNTLRLVGLAMVAFAGIAQAAPVLHEQKSVEIAAPPAKVWATIGNFSEMTWHPAVKTSEATKGNTVGSVRTLDLGGPKLVERLKAYNATKMSYTYVITDDPANVKTLPVTHYTSTIMVAPSGTGSKVTWRGSFKRADASAAPAGKMDDQTALGAVGGVYGGGLDALKTKTYN